MRSEKPIVIVGTGRCGSTMLHRLLARHESVGWLSTFNEALPGQWWLSRFSNLYRQSSLSPTVRHLPFFPKPFEAYRFWEHYLPGFSRRDAPLTADDVYEAGIVPVRRAVDEILRAQSRTRFLVKVTGWSRIEYFDRVFPDACFVFLNREIRSVVSSWVKAGWLDVTSGLDTSGWQWGEVPPLYRDLWEELGGGPILSAAVKIRLDLDDIRRNVALFPERCYELQYEDLIAQPEEELRVLLEFCDLEWTSGFERMLAEHTFHSPVDKWRRHLSDGDAERVLEFFARADEQWVGDGAADIRASRSMEASGSGAKVQGYEKTRGPGEAPRANA